MHTQTAVPGQHVVVTTNNVGNFFNNGTVDISFANYWQACLWAEATLMALHKSNPIEANMKYFDVSELRFNWKGVPPHLTNHTLITMIGSDIAYDGNIYFPEINNDRYLTAYTVDLMDTRNQPVMWFDLGMSADNLTTAVHYAKARIYENPYPNYYYRIRQGEKVIGCIAWDPSGKYVFYRNELWMIFSEVDLMNSLTVANFFRADFELVNGWYQDFFKEYRCTFFNLMTGEKRYSE